MCVCKREREREREREVERERKRKHCFVSVQQNTLIVSLLKRWP